MAERPTLNQQIGARIRHFRRQQNYTITQLGKMVCKSKATISKYETGEISMDLTTLYDIAAALQVSPLALQPLSEDTQGPVSFKSTDNHEPDGQIDKFYVYTYNGLASTPLRRHILLVGSHYAEHYADVYDYENYVQCAFFYRGEVQRTESSIRLFMENAVNPMDRCFLTYPAPLSQQNYYLGLLTSVSISQYPPFSIKILLSYHEQKDEQWLKEQLILSKDDLKRIRRKNIFYVVQPEMEGMKI